MLYGGPPFPRLSGILLEIEKRDFEQQEAVAAVHRAIPANATERMETKKMISIREYSAHRSTSHRQRIPHKLSIQRRGNCRSAASMH